MYNEDIKYHAINRLTDMIGYGVEKEDIHFHLFNEDYFIIGRYQASEFLKEVGTFEAIGIIKEYEKDNFGEVTTDLSEPERVANMYAYIKGEEL